MSKPSTEHKARKRFGQNFLHDQHIIARIVKTIAPQPGQALVEIGPGRGAITELLLNATDKLDVIEIDRDLSEILRSRFGSHPGFTLHEHDVLKFNFNNLINATDTPTTIRVLGNLPYNISTPLIFHLLQYHSHIQDMVFMLQLEVVDRMAAGVGDKNYGRLSVMVQYFCEVEKMFQVPPGAFQPQPKVDSAIVKLSPYTQLPFPAKNHTTLQNVVRAAFNQRRKTIRNTLKNFMDSSKLSALDIDLTLRPENLSLEDYVRISDFLDQQQ